MPHPTAYLCNHTDKQFRTLWIRLGKRLDQWNADWRLQIDLFAGPPKRASASPPFAIIDREAFAAFAVALISGNTRWDRIEAIQSELDRPFEDFDPRRFGEIDDAQIGEIVGWFRERSAGSARLGASLQNLRLTARILSKGKGYASADAFLTAAFECADGSPERVAALLGTDPAWKLPGFGIPLAAEALRNLGFDLCKPDRHVLRAVASWKLVSFPKWQKKGAYTAPMARPAKLLETMFMVRRLAEAVSLPVTRVSSAIWIAGAVSGARLDNAELVEVIGDDGRLVGKG